MVLDDSDIIEYGRPLPIHQVIRVIRTLKFVAYSGCKRNAATTSSGNSKEGGKAEAEVETFTLYLTRAASKLLRCLYEKWSRKVSKDMGKRSLHAATQS